MRSAPADGLAFTSGNSLPVPSHPVRNPPGDLAGLTENASYRCNIGVVNVGSGAATALVELYDGGGTKLTDYMVSLAAGQWAQETQPFKNKAGQTSMDRGYARITVQSGSGVFGFASVVDNLTNDPTTVAMQR